MRWKNSYHYVFLSLIVMIFISWRETYFWCSA